MAGGLRGALAAAGVGGHGFYIGAVAPPLALRAGMGAGQHCPAGGATGQVVGGEGRGLGGPVVVACQTQQQLMSHQVFIHLCSWLKIYFLFINKLNKWKQRSVEVITCFKGARD